MGIMRMSMKRGVWVDGHDKPTNEGLYITTPGMEIFQPFHRALIKTDDLDLRRSRAFMNSESLFTKNDGHVHGISPLDSSFKWSDHNSISLMVV
jgi:hypothetical protein